MNRMGSKRRNQEFGDDGNGDFEDDFQGGPPNKRGRNGSRDTEHLRKVFIGGLSANTTEESLKSHFEEWGEIVDCVVMRDANSKRSRGFGFITYKNEGDVDNAQNNRPHTLDGKEVETKRATPREESMKPESRMSIKKLFVGGVKEDIDDEHLQDYFSKYGTITSVDVITDKGTGKKRGFAFVAFDDYDPVDKIVLKKPHYINERRCDVKKALSKEELEKARAKEMTMQQRQGMGGGGGYGGGFGGGFGQGGWGGGRDGGRDGGRFNRSGFGGDSDIRGGRGNYNSGNQGGGNFNNRGGGFNQGNDGYSQQSSWGNQGGGGGSNNWGNQTQSSGGYNQGSGFSNQGMGNNMGNQGGGGGSNWGNNQSSWGNNQGGGMSQGGNQGYNSGGSSGNYNNSSGGGYSYNSNQGASGGNSWGSGGGSGGNQYSSNSGGGGSSYGNYNSGGQSDFGGNQRNQGGSFGGRR